MAGMNITYFIQLFDDQLEQCQWLRFNERTPVGAAQTGGFEFILDEARGQHVVLILPAASVVLHKVNLLAKSRSQIQAALPFALEEQLASDVDTMHFAYRTLDRQSGEQLVAVIDRAFMEALFGLLAQRKFASVKILPQTLVVPFEEGAWSLFSQRDYTILRKGLSEGYAMDAIAMDELIATEAEFYKQQNESDPEITRYDFSPGTEQEHPAGGDSAALAVIARYCLDHPDAGINLLQGEFQLVKPMGDVIRQWSRVAALAGVALFFYLVTVGAENYRLASERDRLQASMQELYQQIFNEEPTETERPVDAMRRKLVSIGKDTRGVDNFISVILASGKEFIADTKSTVSRLRFTGDAIEVDLETVSIEQLEKLQQRIAKVAVDVELKAVTTDNGKVRGRLVLKAQQGGQS